MNKRSGCKYHYVNNNICPKFFDNDALDPFKKVHKGRGSEYKYCFGFEEDDVGIVNKINILQKR